MRIGYYAHHHGSGHCRQADKLAALLPDDVREQLIVFTSLEADTYRFTSINEQQIMRLYPEDERRDDVLTGRAGEYWKPAGLHYSPVGNIDIQRRSHQILDTIHQYDIDLMIIDVSAEIAMLCRVASVPYLYVRLPGIRDDTAHLETFAGALALLAPYPQSLESTHTAEWVCDKTLYLDFIYTHNTQSHTREDFIDILTQLDTNKHLSTTAQFSKPASIYESEPTISAIPIATIQPIVTVIKGYGGHQSIDEKLPELRELLPHALIVSLGPIDDDKRGYVDISAQVDDVTPFINHSDYLIMACGLNAVAQAYHYATPLVVIPDDRPHQEQVVMAQALLAQDKALNWEQFKALMIAQHGKSECFDTMSQAMSHAPEKQYRVLVSNDDIDETNTLMAAQAFMNSLCAYPSTKLWFENWLLTKIKSKPGSTHKQ